MFLKRFLIILCIIFSASTCWGANYFVVVDKVGIVYKGHEAGQTELGDIVAIIKSDTFNPTRAEKDRYHIFEVDTDDTIFELLQPELETETIIQVDGVEINDPVEKAQYYQIKKARKKKIDFVALNKNKKRLSRNELDLLIIDKSVVVVSP